MNWLKENYKTVLVGILGLVIGSYANYRVNQKTNAELLASLKEELATLKLQNSSSRLSIEGVKQMEILQAQINILENR